ncbi:MAG: signal peptide peptidase SppA [Chroococcidiopsidaceae cyanobacterium CP_BM_ER_R8_30]|nr:signal peptide peptidase SppA [Chroococcidiopsidaceae cyanobacterium CP_BM_ER_R8_30]
MRNFIKQTFASVIGSLLGLLIFFGIGIGGLLLLLIALTPKAAPIQDKSVLVFDLSLDITDAKPTSDASSAIQSALAGQTDNSISLRTVLDTLDRARQDRRIVGVYLDGTKGSGSSSTGLATLREVRAALERFRAAGKTIVAYNMDWSQKEYYLGSVANTVVLNPLGEMEVKGLSSQMMFFTGAFQKYGIGIQVVRVGKFKGAVEPFVLDKLSPDNRLQTQQLLDGIWGEWRSSVSSSRKLNPQQLQTIADNQGLLTADAAKARGLVDRVAYFDQVLGQLKQLTGSRKEDRTFKQVSLTKYAEQENLASGASRSSQNKIAVVYAEGDIVDGEGGARDVGGDRFARVLRKLRQDDGVKAVVLRINSPGGSVTAAEVIQREVDLTRQVKPVIVSMGDVAASGGYWISADANRIFAEPNTITGSIGVFGLLFNFQKLANNNGITWDVVKTARFADSQTVSRPKTPQELAIYQQSVDRVYNLFLNRVAAGRKLPKQRVAQIAQGRVWSGEEAKQIGLVDDLGGLDAAIQYAARQAHLGKDWELKEYPETHSLEQRLLGRMTSDAYEPIMPANPLAAEFQKLQTALVMLQKMNDPQSIYARLPFNLKIE